MSWIGRWGGSRSGLRELSRGVCDAVAGAGDGLDRRWGAEFAAEPADGDLDGLGERVNVLVPGPGEEVFGAEGGGGCFHQGLEHGEFLDRDVDLAAVAGDGAVERVELCPGRAQDAGLPLNTFPRMVPSSVIPAHAWSAMTPR